MAEIFNHGYGLLIGVGESAYPKLSLPVTVKDTQSLYAALINSDLCAYPNNEDHIRVLNDEKATRSEILEGLKWLKTKTEADSEATALVYYSGHGWLETSNNHYYLLQHNIDPFDIPGSALSSEDFTNALRQIQSERLLVVLDCCHAAGMATSKEGEAVAPPKLPPGFTEVPPLEAKGLIDALKQGKGRVVFTSSRGEQKSWIKDQFNSIYTYHFLEALQGADNKPGDTEVRVSNLMHYLGKAVPESAKRLHGAEQNPWFDMGTEDFVIAKLRGGKGLPEKGWEAVKPEATQKINQIAKNIYQYGKYIINIQKAEGIHIGDKA
ncbi:caspase family protein [Nostoc cf. edaphicum LEGE 07299]|uniref:Caspase family protein n=1 Tax=Nostoc cf. edaphicum LEGE 07299 TaxID=2777974 RepID=A0ABR9U3D1_9NOSO|nr:caspase family protein [Nostoc edaphicum]MBE9106872.1 caspase family protein [Nostoc cf. edaphicum LEGE 07299]